MADACYGSASRSLPFVVAPDPGHYPGVDPAEEQSMEASDPGVGAMDPQDRLRSRPSLLWVHWCVQRGRCNSPSRPPDQCPPGPGRLGGLTETGECSGNRMGPSLPEIGRVQEGLRARRAGRAEAPSSAGGVGRARNTEGGRAMEQLEPQA